MRVIVDLVLRNRNSIRQCDAGDLALEAGEQCIVELPEGPDVGTVTLGSRAMGEQLLQRTPPRVVRRISKEDLDHLAYLERREREAFAFCLERIRKHELPMKLVMTEFLYDGRKAYFYFTADGRVDFRALVRDLARRYRTRIEMKQIGVRDKSRLLGGFGPCGRSLCCATFLTSFKPVSIKMAKKQNLSMNVNKLTGMCGRLKCCVAFEFNPAAEKLSDQNEEKTPDAAETVAELEIPAE